MRFIPLNIAEPDMKLAYDIYDTNGLILVSANSVLTESIIKRLKEYGFSGIYVLDTLTEDIEVYHAISQTLRNEAMNCVKQQNIDGCVEFAKMIIEELMQTDRITLDLRDLRSYDDYTYAHSVNVAVLCCTIGLGMNLSTPDLENLVTAALLHDFGKMQIPPEILNKPSRLTPEEYSVMKSHPMKSYMMIKDKIGLSAHVKNTVLYHHENFDGSGYPCGIDYTEQSQLVRILHVADVYDALVSKRPYKEPYSPLDASEYLMGGCGILFDQDVVKALLSFVPLFPKGTTIQLSDNREGVIFDNIGFHNLRPIIKLTDGELIDLTSSDNLSVGISSTSYYHDLSLEQSEMERKEMMKENNERSHILVVDDLKTNLEVIRSILEAYFDLTFVKSGKQAVKYIETKQRPDLILMDVDMPEMDGLTCARIINEMTNHSIPILFVSAIANQDIVKGCREIGAAGYIVRPYNPVYMKSEIKRILYGNSVDEV